MGIRPVGGRRWALTRVGCIGAAGSLVAAILLGVSSSGAAAVASHPRSPHATEASATPPGAPTIVKVEPGEASATVVWSAPASDGGSPISSYTVTATPGGATASASGSYLTATVTGLTNGQSYSFQVTATNAIGTGPPSGASGSVTPSHPGSQVIPVSSYRVCDTRAGNPSNLSGTDAQCNGAGNSGTTPGPGAQFQVVVAGTTPSGQTVGGVPKTANAAFVNVTAVNTTGAGSLKVWPSGLTAPLAPSLLWQAGQTVSMLLTVPLASGGAISVQNGPSSTDVLVDVEAYSHMSAGSTTGLYDPTSAYRVCDTRAGNPSQLSGTDGQCNGTGDAGSTLGPGASLTAQVSGTDPSGQPSGGVPSSGVSGVVLNVAVYDTTAAGSLTVWSSSAPQPSQALFSWLAGQNVTERVVLPLSTTGNVTVFNSAGNTDVTLDVDGYLTAAAGTKTSGSYLKALPPVPICDTQAGNPLGLTGRAAQCDGKNNAGRTIGAARSLTIQVAGSGGVPGEATSLPPTAAVLGITAFDATASSSLSVYPAQGAPPVVPDLQWTSGESPVNVLVAGLGDNGKVTLFNSAGDVDVLVEVLGYESGGVSIPASTVPLTPSSLAALSSMAYDSSSKQEVLTFSGSPAQVSSLVPGQVVNAPAATADPDGILEKVTSVSTGSGDTVVNAVPATPSDALNQGSLTYASGPVNYAPGINAALARISEPRSRTSRGNLNKSFACGAQGEVGISAQVNDFSLTPDVSLNWSPFTNLSASASLRLDVAYQHSFQVSGTVSCEEDFPLITPTQVGPTIPVDIGPVFFILSPVATVNFAVVASGQATLTTSSTTTAFYQQAGIHWDNSDGFSVSHSSGCDAPVPAGTPGCSTTSSNPSPGVQLALSGGLEMQVTLAYNWLGPEWPTVGPFLSLTPSLQLAIQPQAPVVSVNFNLKGQVGIQLQVWQINLQVAYDLLNLTWTIFHTVEQVTPANLPDAIAGSAYQTTLSADGGTGPYTWSLPSSSGAPPWLHLSSDGVVSGTPTNPEQDKFSVTVGDVSGEGGPVTSTYTLAVGPSVSLATTTLPDAVINQYYSAQLAGAGGASPYTFSGAGLPSWLTLTSGGVLAGTPPSSAGNTTVPIQVTVTDSEGPAHSDGPHTLDLAVEGFGITTSSLPVAVANQSYSAQLASANGVGADTWSVDPSSHPLPSWLSLSSSGSLTGTPPIAARGTKSTFTVDVQDSSSPAQTAKATLTASVSPWSTFVLPDAYSSGAGEDGWMDSCPTASFCMLTGIGYCPNYACADGSAQYLPSFYWNGTTWTRVTMPTEPNTDEVQVSVSCTSKSFCVAVGEWGQRIGGNIDVVRPLAEVWHGSTWSIVPNPPGVDRQALLDTKGLTCCYPGIWMNDVSCTSPDFCVAVGYQYTSRPTSTFVEQWDGHQWFTVPAPSPGGDESVSCASPQYCVAVGIYTGKVTMEWNGYQWTVDDDPAVNGVGFFDVSCSAVDNCMAAGLGVAVRGTSGWTTGSPNPGSDLDANAVSCVSSTLCWASGQQIEKWSGLNWSTEVTGKWQYDNSDISCADATHCTLVDSLNNSQGLDQIEVVSSG